jgi:hypothetical protein
VADAEFDLIGALQRIRPDESGVMLTGFAENLLNVASRKIGGVEDQQPTFSGFPTLPRHTTSGLRS